ncbi:pectin lyase fold/virulence factor [Russula earlei]|uniref:Pectin lyase fold/virulence factor n=1 Tax=Russula earlei TaxID=71964 RepID=A0ACC0TWQ3_9AGAM|nr:pectin lyase fold/virulence factor [Russula earlei]
MIQRLPLPLFLFVLVFSFAGMAQTQVWVATNGSDTAKGTTSHPLATLAKALRQVRELRRLHDSSIQDGAHIIMEGGVYKQYEPIFIRPEDAGTPHSPTIIEAAPGEHPVISGGITIHGWKKLASFPAALPKAARGKVWVASVPLMGGRPFEFRQLWVNNTKAIRARDVSGDNMHRILHWNKAEQTCWIPTPAIAGLTNATGLEMLIQQWWAVATLRIKTMEVHGDSTKLSFYQPESRIESEHPWPAPWLSKETGNSAFYLTNALALLNEPGEWWLDIANQQLYYWPRENEDLATTTVVAPYLETLIKEEGTPDAPVSHIVFQGISFQHTGWLRPSQQGHVPLQAGMYLLDAYKLKIPGTPDKKDLENQAWVGRPAAAVTCSYADNTSFRDCRFEHLASTGLDYTKGTHDNTIEGNLFTDIGGTGVQLGVFSQEATEVHLPYIPADEREVCSNTLVQNNLITNVTNEDWGCVGIGAGFVKGLSIAHNEINNVSYSGISLGWGWTKTINVMNSNTVFANKIHHYAKHLYDVAAIYTLSAQPNTVISNNYIDSIYKAPYAHLPYHWFYIYSDEGSAYMTIQNNWCPSEKFLQNVNGPNNVWQHNGPMVVDSIRQQAGIQPAWQYLLQDNAPADKNYAINRERPVIIEVIGENNQPVDTGKLHEVLTAAAIPGNSIYQWHNHLVIYGYVNDAFSLTGKLHGAFPSALIKTYDELLYEFNRKHCSDTATAKEWSHTILTANLVADTALQREYVNYHATQFEKWPEVAQGFCNAQFQQLLVFRNGRQLMLVISIPKGESLDHLNPKTTENNPRVDEWNTRMKKYQEGIEGTKKGETWVELKEL